MNPVLKLRYKTKVGALLGALILLLLLNNIAGRQSFTRMQQEATSIYADRLMPSTYLFDIREALYQERLILGSGNASEATAELLSGHRAHIASLISRYEKTVLTPDEQKEWTALKTYIRAFHLAPALSPESNWQLGQALKGLNNLKAIQAGEGAHLQKDLSRIGANSSFRSYLELVLLIIIGSVTLSLIGFSGNALEQTVSHRPSLN